MIVRKKQNSDRNSGEKRSLIPLQAIAILVILGVASLFFFWHQKNFNATPYSDTNVEDPLSEAISVPDQTGMPSHPPAIAGEGPALSPTSEPATQALESSNQSTLDMNDPTSTPAVDMTKLPREGQASSAEAIKISENGSSLVAGNPAYSSKICTEIAPPVKKFFAHLDKQDYLQPYSLTPNSEIYFTALIQRLLDNPPVVSGETNDLYTILQNTAHFFRVIGKDNILLLKAILDREKDQFENILAHCYSLLHVPSCPEQSFKLHITDGALYDYAGFFLNTMGGRLYLFRRDSMSRMVVSYYSILLIDQANKNSSNKHGIDIKNAIDQLIDEIESTSNRLQMKDVYLDKLFALKEEYQ